MFKNKEDKINPDTESNEILANEQAQRETELKESLEKKESTQAEISPEKIREEIEAMDLNDGLKTQVQSHANDFQSLETKEKIKKLLETAKAKGVVFAVNVAKKMNDPYILDTFHDTLAKEGYYKSFLK